MELTELSSLEYKVEPVSPADSTTSNRDWTLSSTARSDVAAEFGGEEEEELFESLWPSIEENKDENTQEDDLFKTEDHLFEDDLLDIVDLEDIILKEEPFSTWLDNTGLYQNPSIATPATTPSQFYDGPTSAQTPPSLWSETSEVKPYSQLQESTPQTQDLFKEFEDVFSQTAGSLTPPDSPKPQTIHAPPITQQLVQQQQADGPNSGYVTVFLENVLDGNSVSELDQIVANEAGVLNGPTLSNTITNLGQASPAASDDVPWSSPSPSTTSGGCSDSGYDDPDWNPQPQSDKPTVSLASSAPVVRRSSTQGRGCRSRPAVGSTEERRMRKKEQNKTAATRYRIKKKQEIEGIIGEERVLSDKNERLKADATEITREIRYLKSLMRDLLKAKGLLSS